MIKRLLVVIVIAGILGWGLGQTPWVQKILYPYPHRQTVEKYANEYGVDPLLVVSVMREESKFLPRSESQKGALGLMQLMPSTARWIAQNLEDTGYTDEYLVDPEKNIQYGTWYLSSLEKEFSGNTTLVVTAYNGGRGRVKEWIATGQLDPVEPKVADIPYRETREYTERVLKSYQRYTKLYPK